MSRPRIVVLNASHSVVEGHVESPGMLRHREGDVVKPRIATEAASTRLDKSTTRRCIDMVR